MSERSERYDIDLLLAAQGGDVTAYGELYRRHARAVLRYAWAALGQRGDAEDALQDTFTTAWAKRRRASIVDESMLPWLLAVCRNHVRNQLRRRRKHAADELGDHEQTTAHEPGELVAMRVELDRLSPTDRRLCELCLGYGYSYREAAEILGTTETAVGKRLQRSRARLRVALGADGRTDAEEDSV